MDAWARCIAKACITCMFVAGCGHAALHAERSTLAATGRRYMIHLPGMPGWIDADSAFVLGLSDARFADRYEVYDWTGGHWMIGAVWARRDNQAQARRIADAIASKLRQEPDAQIILTAWSAGAAVALWTLEDLPPDVKVRSVLLLEPAIDPRHDLRPAIGHVRGKMFITQSDGDGFMLGLGPVLFGASDDGAHTPAAGYVGMHVDPGADATLGGKLEVIRYEPAWKKWGNSGGHAGPLSRAFASHVLAPLLSRAERSPVE